MKRVRVRERKRRGKKFIVLEINPECSADGMRKTIDAPVQTKTAAEEEAQKIVAAALRGELFVAPRSRPRCVPVPSSRVPTLRDVYLEFKSDRMPPPEVDKRTSAVRWVATYKPSVCRRYEALIERQGILDVLGDDPVDCIDEERIRVFGRMLLRGERPAPGRRRGINPRGPVNAIFTLLNYALEKKHIARVPARPPEFTRQPKKLPVSVPLSEARPALEAATGWLKGFIGCAMFAGLRLSEIRALTVADADLVNGELRVTKTYSEDVLVDLTKTDQDRTIPIHADLRPILAGAARDKQLRDALFTTGTGAVPVRTAVLSRYKALQRRLGLRAARDEWSFHSLRHLFGSQLARDRAPLPTIMELMGHSSLAVTSRYLRATGRDHREAIARFGASVGTDP